jgi:hypothetical protein
MAQTVGRIGRVAESQPDWKGGPAKNRTLILLLAVAAGALWAAACSGDDEGSTSSTAGASSLAVTSTAPPTSGTAGGSTDTATSTIPETTSTTGQGSVNTLGENDIHELAAASWSPVESIPEAAVKTISDALSAHGLHMLFPSAVPFAATDPVSAEFTMQWVPATGVIDLIVRVGTDHGAWVALWSSPTASQAVTFGTEDPTRATEVTVRGLPGLFFPRSDETTQIVSWQEQGQYFAAWHRWLPLELAPEQVISWLESWYRLP